jgi:hypothetical protein
MLQFEGTWKYQSYRFDPAPLAEDQTAPKLVKWSPPGIVTIDDDGATGKLEFVGTGIKLDLQFNITHGSPSMLSITAAMSLPAGGQFTNALQGWFVPAQPGQDVSKGNPLVVRGSIVQTSADIAPPPARQPMFTTGYFILQPA